MQPDPSDGTRRVKSITMQKRYIQEIRSGAKTVEGRVGISIVKNIHAGQLLRFYYMANSRDDVVCLVERVERYESFREMLKVGSFSRAGV
jgi:ASC-1-like (ASCH) protein